MRNTCFSEPRLFHLDRYCRSVVSVALLAALNCGVLGCTAAIKQAAETAAPAAVEEAVEEASKPSTRDAVAEILEDPDIRASSAELSEAVTQGVVRGVENEVPKVQRLSDAVVTSVSASVARSLERDVVPQLSAAVGRVIDESLAHALNEQTEERVQAAVAALTRATVNGASEALSPFPVDTNGDPLNAPSAQLSQNAWYSLGYNGARGFERAVRDAQLTQQEGNQPSVLATLGTLSDLTRMLPFVLLSVGAIVILGLAAALVWALVALKRERRRASEKLTSEQLSSVIRQARGNDGWKPLPNT